VFIFEQISLWLIPLHFSAFVFIQEHWVTYWNILGPMTMSGVFKCILELSFFLWSMQVDHLKIWRVGFVLLQEHWITYWNILGPVAMSGVFYCFLELPFSLWCVQVDQIQIRRTETLYGRNFFLILRLNL